jgi:hypothetical protein
MSPSAGSIDARSTLRWWRSAGGGLRGNVTGGAFSSTAPSQLSSFAATSLSPH